MSLLLSAAEEGWEAAGGGRLRDFGAGGLFLDLLFDTTWLESHVRESAAATPSAKGAIHDEVEGEVAMVECLFTLWTKKNER